MKRREFLAFAAGAVMFPRVAAAQTAKMPRVTLVSGGPASEMALASPDLVWAALFQELADQGFVEGRTVIFERYTTTAAAQTSTAAVQEETRAILATNPDVIYFQSTNPHAQAAL